MNMDLNTPLSDDEFDLLADFLLDRIDESKLEVGVTDEGVLTLPELDGFFTAIVSGPVTAPPSVWLPALWADCPPAFEDEQAFTAVFTLFVRFMNSITDVLMVCPEDFEPILFESGEGDDAVVIFDEWCEGYMRGVAIAEEQWFAGGADMAQLLAPIIAFTEAGDWLAHSLDEEERADTQEAILAAVPAIHAYWLVRRSPAANASTFVNTQPQVGRNDPCPCGSGKKYKKCCLQ